MSRIDNIKNFKLAQDMAGKQAELDKRDTINSLKTIICTFYDRLKELLEVGLACQENGIELTGSGWGGHEGYDTHQFLSNSWSHLTGFIPWYQWNKEEAFDYPQNERYKIKGFGIIGGGACGYKLLIGIDNGMVEIRSWGDEIYVLNRFITEFDTFEKEFYSYVDKVTGIK